MQVKEKGEGRRKGTCKEGERGHARLFRPLFLFRRKSGLNNLACPLSLLNERLFATGGREKTLRIWDFPSDRLRVAIQAHPRNIQSVAFSPDFRVLASCGYSSETKL